MDYKNKCNFQNQIESNSGIDTGRQLQQELLKQMNDNNNEYKGWIYRLSQKKQNKWNFVFFQYILNQRILKGVKPKEVKISCNLQNLQIVDNQKLYSDDKFYFFSKNQLLSFDKSKSDLKNQNTKIDNNSVYCIQGENIKQILENFEIYEKQQRGEVDFYLEQDQLQKLKENQEQGFSCIVNVSESKRNKEFFQKVDKQRIQIRNQYKQNKCEGQFKNQDYQCEKIYKRMFSNISNDERFKNLKFSQQYKGFLLFKGGKLVIYNIKEKESINLDSCQLIKQPDLDQIKIKNQKVFQDPSHSYLLYLKINQGNSDKKSLCQNSIRLEKKMFPMMNKSYINLQQNSAEQILNNQVQNDEQFLKFKKMKSKTVIIKKNQSHNNYLDNSDNNNFNSFNNINMNSSSSSKNRCFFQSNDFQKKKNEYNLNNKIKMSCGKYENKVKEERFYTEVGKEECEETQQENLTDRNYGEAEKNSSSFVQRIKNSFQKRKKKDIKPFSLESDLFQPKKKQLGNKDILVLGFENELKRNKWMYFFKQFDSENQKNFELEEELEIQQNIENFYTDSDQKNDLQNKKEEIQLSNKQNEKQREFHKQNNSGLNFNSDQTLLKFKNYNKLKSQAVFSESENQDYYDIFNDSFTSKKSELQNSKNQNKEIQNTSQENKSILDERMSVDYQDSQIYLNISDNYENTEISKMEIQNSFSEQQNQENRMDISNQSYVYHLIKEWDEYEKYFQNNLRNTNLEIKKFLIYMIQKKHNYSSVNFEVQLHQLQISENTDKKIDENIMNECENEPKAFNIQNQQFNSNQKNKQINSY